MRYLIFTVLFSMLFVAESAFAQQRHNPGKQKMPHHNFSDSLITQLPSVIGDKIHSISGRKTDTMPIYDPGNVDAKMKFWWPSTNYRYNMPNPYFGKGSRLNSRDKNKKNR